ncbi:UBC-like protein [Zalerion maritima]|uniref:UBC-like protein n=1 Tax=Zalerion maritima TaxID=339359 RepID=A0AAD5RVD3_9PEZI|nr:UBC-like protein [Zalerion maritima]
MNTAMKSKSPTIRRIRKSPTTYLLPPISSSQYLPKLFPGREMPLNGKQHPPISYTTANPHQHLREAQELAQSPSPDYTASPLETDLFEWHFTLRGPPSSPYSQGIYHGRISLPPTYPLRPPNFRFVTPNGRFETNREICLSISGHHEETWQPAWGVRTAIVALRSFMETNAEGQLGGLTTTEDRKKDLALQSRSFVCAACSGGKTNGEIMAECEKLAREAAEREGSEGSSSQKKEIEIPKELRLGFKDELEKKAEGAAAAAAAAASTSEGNTAGSSSNVTAPPTGPSPAGSASSSSAQPPTGAVPRIVTRTDSMDSESAALAEGFVQTAPETAQPAPAPTRTQQHPRARPGQGAPEPTGAADPPPWNNLDLVQQQRGNEEVPRWVDNAIYIIICLLIAMVLKVLAS